METLPDEVLTNILSRVNVIERLQNCAFVNQRWSSLATAPVANTHICLEHGHLSRNAVSDLQDWLVQHGQLASHLDLTGPGIEAADSLQLPCPKLQQLHLRSFCVHFPDVFVGCTDLKVLRLVDCEVNMQQPELMTAAPPALHSLIHLDIESKVLRWLPDIPGGLLPQTEQLTYLRMAGTVTDETLAGLQDCTKLRVLSLDLGVGAASAAAALQPLGHLTALTKLALEWQDGYCYSCPDVENALYVTSNNASKLSRLTALQDLQVSTAMELQPVLLQRLTGLTSLFIEGTRLRGRQEGGEAVMGATEMLAVLSQLTRLRRLSLKRSFWVPAELDGTGPVTAGGGGSDTDNPDCYGEDAADEGMDHPPEAAGAGGDAAAPAGPAEAAAAAAAVLPPPALEAYSALTPSALEYLDLTDCYIPAAALLHMFRPGLQLLQLRVLRLAGSKRCIPMPVDAYASMVGCCPNLEELATCGSSNPLLTDLPQTLTKLHIESTSNSVAYSIAQLTHLESLSVEQCNFNDRAMLALTALRRLTELEVVSRCFSDEFERACIWHDDNDYVRERTYRRAAGWPWQGRWDNEDTPVWGQLLQDCMRSEQCQRSIYRTIAAAEGQE